MTKWQVEDSYGKVWYTGTLRACGVWIDPVLGIDFDCSEWGKPCVDRDRITKNADGSWTVQMYENMGELTVRKVQ